MAEVKNSFIQSKMNKDLDERLLPNNSYRDALNLAVSRSEGSDVGSLEAILGNSKVTSDSNLIIIGTYVDENNGLVYVFSTDHTTQGQAAYNAQCSISVFNISTGSFSPIIQGSIQYPSGWLNFSTVNPINSISLIENLLYWTDNRNQPRKINVDNPLYYYTCEEQVSVAKFSPYLAPEFIDNRSLSQIKPSTMSDASDPSVVSIGIYELTSENLAVKKYRNGDQIPEATTLAAWQTYNNAQQGCWSYYNNYLGNDVTYGVLYNKWAILDSRELAPVGHRIPTLAEWNGIVSSAGANGAIQMKSENFWSSGAGNNLTGADIRPNGYRLGVAANNDFAGLLTESRIWTADGVSYIKYNTTNSIDTTGTGAANDGYAVRLLKDANYNGWNGDPDYLTEKFVKFSYRFKFDDNEYSTVAPFSQDVFIPYQQGQFVNEDENQAFITTVVEFMENSINNAVLNITLPCVDIITKYKIKAIDIVFKQSDMQAYQLLETITVDDGSAIENNSFITALNNTNIYQYSYESTLPIKTLPSAETTRVYDKVPVKALAQETSGNRIMYANYLEGYTAPRGLSYFADSNFKTTQSFEEYPQHSIKQNRNYQIGVVLADKWGRQTDVILSTQDGVLDSDGNPQPGSNVFIPYFPASFSTSVQAWLGSNLTVQFTQLIPEIPNSNGLSGYPGAYAEGNYYTVDSTPNTGADQSYCWSYSTQAIVATSNQTVFDFTGLLYADATGSNNVLNIYINSGSGWVLQATNTYASSLQNTKLRVTFNTGVSLNYSVKAEILFKTSYDSFTTPLYKYEIGANSGTVRPLFAGWKDNYATYFAANKNLRGEYVDYTNIPSSTSVVPILDGNGDVRSLTFYTKEEIASNYLFNNTQDASRPEPSLNGEEKTFATYDINPNGFYSYKIAVKQQQQDYYNVYLPGIINGYPIEAETKERGEIAFTTLISDNINKIPRNLQDVGPIQNQFTSDINLFGRVTNIVGVASTAPLTYKTYNRQYVPSSTADSADLIGTTADVFPGVDFGTSAGEINQYTIYDSNTKPYVAKISTRNSIGLTEDLYTVPVNGSGNYPYPPNLGLAVYETTPFESQLEIYYETSTAGLISDLNENISNDNLTNITGLSSITSLFQERMLTGTVLTNDFFPTAGGVNITSTTLQSFTVFSYDSNNSLDTSTPQTSRFVVESGSQNGSFRVKTNDTFYAGSQSESTYFVDTRGKFLFTLNFLQADGVVASQTFTIQLVNDDPVISEVSNPVVTPVSTSVYTATSGGSGGVVQSPSGQNGSAANPSSVSNGNWSTFTSTTGWTVIAATRTTNAGAVTNYDTSNMNTLYNTGANGAVPFQTNSSDGLLRFALNCVDGEGNVVGASYQVTLRLTDSLGRTADVNISYTVASTIYGTVVATDYESGNCLNSTPANISGTTNLQRTNLSMPQWNGQIQNWTSDVVYVWIKTSVSTGPSTQQNAGTTNMIGGTYADGTSSKTDGDGNSLVINGSTSGVNAEIGTYISSGGSSSIFVLAAILQPFTQSAGSATSTMATLKAAGVVPGMKNTNASGNLGVYDFSACALVNAEYRMTVAIFGAVSGSVFISTQQSGIPFQPTNASAIVNVQSNTNPPFVGNKDTNNKIICPTTTPIASGPIS